MAGLLASHSQVFSCSNPTYLWGQRWTIDPDGVPSADTRVIDHRGVFSNFDRGFYLNVGCCPSFPWTEIQFIEVSTNLVGSGINVGVTEGQLGGCFNHANATSCLCTVTDEVGVYTISATVTPGTGAGLANIVVGGGSPEAIVGPQVFQFSGAANGNSMFGIDLTLGNDQPGLAYIRSLEPGTSGGEIATQFAAWISGMPGFVATSDGMTGNFGFLTVDTVPPGMPFRMWIGPSLESDGSPGPDCQATGNTVRFNPTITYIGGKIGDGPIPTVSEWGLIALAVLLLIAGTLVQMRQRLALGVSR